MLRAPLIVLLLLIHTTVIGTLVLLTGLVKLLTFGRARHAVVNAASWIADRWIQGNDLVFDALLSTKWRIEGFDGLRPDGRYLMICNHISWVDIFAVLRATYSGDAPFIRFFIKHTLLWFPIVGQACAALDFPFMRRYTPEYLKHHPEKKGRDLETTRKACERYQHIPVTVANFLEGTRFTRQKYEDQQSPYRHLLRPRMGGLAFVLASLGDQFDAVLDVTLVYPHRDVTMLDFVCNRIPWIVVSARRIEVPGEFLSAAITEPGPVRESFKVWVDELWRTKDEEIDRILLESKR
ncbi:MAG TPA: acetyltransferase [Thermoanaerobaculia bacterium]